MTHKNRYILRWVFPALLCFILAFNLFVPARAADLIVRTPAEMDAEIYPSDDGYLMSLTPDPEWTFWERYANGSVYRTYSGATIGNQLQERHFDNYTYSIYPFGQNGVLPLAGLSADATWDTSITFQYEQLVTISQSFDITLCAYLVHVDSSGNVMMVYPGEPYTWTFDATTYTKWTYHLTNSFEVFRNTTFNVFNGDGGYFYLYYTCEFGGLTDQTVTDYVTIYLSSSCNLSVPVSPTYGAYLQSGKTNAYLSRIERELQSQGQTLDQILNGSDEQQNSADDFNSDMNGIVPGINTDLNNLDNVPKPDVSDIKTDLNTLVGSDGVSGANNILAGLTGYSVVSSQIVIALTMMLLGYVLFGKRG